MSEIWLTPTDIKQYFYCKAIPYLNHVMGIWEEQTEYKAQGKETHLNLQEIEKRRKTLLKHLKLPPNSKKLFRVPLRSQRLMMKGVLDCLIITPNEYIPIEYKVARKPKKVPLNHKYQITAYALLVEDTFNTIIRKTYIYYQENDKIVKINITDSLRKGISKVICELNEIINYEKEPLVRPSPPICKACLLNKVCPWSLI